MPPPLDSRFQVGLSIGGLFSMVVWRRSTASRFAWSSPCVGAASFAVRFHPCETYLVLSSFVALTRSWWGRVRCNRVILEWVLFARPAGLACRQKIGHSRARLPFSRCGLSGSDARQFAA